MELNNWKYTDLSGAGAVELTIGDSVFKVSQLVTSFARNEIPKATCMVAIGRNTANVNISAAIHRSVSALSTHQDASITVFPRGDSNVDGQDWPGQPSLLFEGRFQGYSYRKINGQVQVVIQLVHWLSLLGDGSALNAFSHPQNPSSLVFPSLLSQNSPGLSSGAQGSPVFLADRLAFQLSRTDVADDLWAVLKSYLYAIASANSWLPAGQEGCLSGLQLTASTGAVDALSRIEGKIDGPASRDYRFGNKLPLANGHLPAIVQGVLQSLSQIRTEDVANQTLWDILVGHFCPKFGLALIPMADRALIVADTPGYNGGVYREITPREYSGMDYNPTIAKPLRAVGVVVGDASRSGFGSTIQAGGEQSTPAISGCYVSSSQADAAGTVLLVGPPPWLKDAAASGELSSYSTELVSNNSIPSSTTPGASTTPLPGNQQSILQSVTDTLRLYAQKVYIDNNLRTRVGSFTGPLRFDICPGSHLHIVGSPEVFIGIDDALASDLYGDVARVTVSINIETSQASTSFQLTHVRTTEENADERTSIATHPLYNTDQRAENNVIFLGAPLVEGLSFDGL